MVYCENNKLLSWRKGDTLYMAHIQDDECPLNPRTDFDNNDIMACWHRRYILGDEKVTKGKSTTEFWQDLVRQNIGEKELLAKAEAGKIKDVHIERINENLVTVCFLDDGEENFRCEEVSDITAVYYIIDELTVSQCMSLMKPYAVWLPLWLYDHSGLSMSCGERVYPYNDSWDSGQVGWIIMTKATALKELTEVVKDRNGVPEKELREYPGGFKLMHVKTRPLTEETWRTRAIEAMKASVKEYDLFLRGETYGYYLYSADLSSYTEDERAYYEPDWKPEEEGVFCGGYIGDDVLTNGMADDFIGFRDALALNEVTEGTCTYKAVPSFNVPFPGGI